MKELQRQASPNIVIALAGNKADLATKRAVDFQVSGNLVQLLPEWSRKQLCIIWGFGVYVQIALRDVMKFEIHAKNPKDVPGREF